MRKQLNFIFYSFPINMFHPQFSLLRNLSISCLFFGLLTSSAWAADFKTEMQEASKIIHENNQELERLAHAEGLNKANAYLLSKFPKETRNGAQSLILGNMLYGIDPKMSYALHQEAVEKFPHEPSVLMEWAMELHRSGDYENALKAYDEYSKSDPQLAPIHGLAADCLIRLGKTREAAARWKLSETARKGSLEMFESMVCDIYKDSTLEQKHFELTAKTAQGDIDAAVQLVALDGDFERDWWNKSARKPYLKSDLALLQKLPASPRVNSALCAVECLLEEEDIKVILTRHGLLTDDLKTIPQDGSLFALVLSTAIKKNVFTREDARQRFGEKLRTIAQTSTDVDLLNAIAYLYGGTPEMADIEKQAWDATSDARFATRYLWEKDSNGTLKSNDVLLEKAMAQFPENSVIMAIAMHLETSPKEDLLVKAIKAEYRKFSPDSDGLTLLRPRADALRRYFSQLSKIVK